MPTPKKLKVETAGAEGDAEEEQAEKQTEPEPCNEDQEEDAPIDSEEIDACIRDLDLYVEVKPAMDDSTAVQSAKPDSVAQTWWGKFASPLQKMETALGKSFSGVVAQLPKDQQLKSTRTQIEASKKMVNGKNRKKPPTGISAADVAYLNTFVDAVTIASRDFQKFRVTATEGKHITLDKLSILLRKRDAAASWLHKTHLAPYDWVKSWVRVILQQNSPTKEKQELTFGLWVITNQVRKESYPENWERPFCCGSLADFDLCEGGQHTKDVREHRFNILIDFLMQMFKIAAYAYDDPRVLRFFERLSLAISDSADKATPLFETEDANVVKWLCRGVLCGKSSSLTTKEAKELGDVFMPKQNKDLSRDIMLSNGVNADVLGRRVGRLFGFAYGKKVLLKIGGISLRTETDDACKVDVLPLTEAVDKLLELVRRTAATTHTLQSDDDPDDDDVISHVFPRAMAVERFWHTMWLGIRPLLC